MFYAIFIISFFSLPVLFIMLIASFFTKKNGKKRALSLLIAFVLMLFSASMIADSLPIESTSKEEADVSSEPSDSSEPIVDSIESTPTTESTFLATEEGAVIYSNYGIEITYKKVNNLKSFDYEITNNSDADISYFIGGVAVNNCMAPDLMAMTPLTSGNKVIDRYDISGAKDYGIKEVETLDVYFVFQGANYETIDAVVCHIDVAEGDNFVYQIDDTAFYDSEYVSAYFEKKGTKYKDIDVIYYNKTNSVISAMLTEVSINGVMLSTDAMLYYNILPGCYAYTGASDGTVTLWDALESEVKEKELEPIERFQAKVKLIGDGMSKYIVTSDNITIYQ